VTARPSDVSGQVLQRLALGAAALAALLVVGSAALGPSAAQPALGPRGPGWRGVLPPYDLGAQPASWVVTVVVDSGYVLGAVAVALGLLAVRRGALLPRGAVPVAVAVALVAALVPPSGSADHLNYAAYGRIQAQGGDPYTVAPAQWDGGRDPVTSAVEDPWTRTPSIYGPVATQLQAMTSRFGGDDLRATVWGWQLLCLLAWLAVGLLLARGSGRRPPGRALPGDEPSGAGPPGDQAEGRVGAAGTVGDDRTAATSRAAWLWLLNPVLLGVLLVGAHVDLLGAALALVAVLLAARRPVLAGAALGAAVGLKVTFALVGPALLWALWRRRRRTGEPWAPAAVFGVLGTAAVVVPFYALAGPHALDQLSIARRYVSLATPWRPVVDAVTGPVANGDVRAVVAVAAPVVVLLVLGALALALRGSAASSSSTGSTVHRGTPDTRDSVATTQDAALASVVLATAYLLAAPYSLPWYDALAWAPLGLVAAGVLDALLLVRLASLAVAYVPGRVLGMSERVRDVTLGYRTNVAPWIGWALLVAIGWLAARSWQSRRDEPARPGTLSRTPVE
jgi:Glycosyltransferase family 87